MRVQSVGIIGNGAFGAFIAVLLERFAPNVQVRIFSRKHPADGQKFFSLEDACASDAVILAVPIRAFEETLKQVLPLIPEQAVIVDVATVKIYTTDLLKKYASGRRYIATHPMFGPESYAKTGGKIEGYRIVITEHTLEAGEYAELISTLSSAGFSVVESTSEEHDRQLASTLFLTHFIGQVITRAGFERTKIDTVSFGFLMQAVEIVRVNTALFQDVFKYNPYCKTVLDRLEHAEKETYAILAEATGAPPA